MAVNVASLRALIVRPLHPLVARVAEPPPRPRKDALRYRGAVSGVTAAGPGMANLQIKLDPVGRYVEGGQSPTVALTVPIADARGAEIGDRWEWIGRRLSPDEEDDES